MGGYFLFNKPASLLVVLLFLGGFSPSGQSQVDDVCDWAGVCEYIPPNPCAGEPGICGVDHECMADPDACVPSDPCDDPSDPCSVPDPCSYYPNPCDPCTWEGDPCSVPDPCAEPGDPCSVTEPCEREPNPCDPCSWDNDPCSVLDPSECVEMETAEKIAAPLQAKVGGFSDANARYRVSAYTEPGLWPELIYVSTGFSSYKPPLFSLEFVKEEPDFPEVLSVWGLLRVYDAGACFEYLTKATLPENQPGTHWEGLIHYADIEGWPHAERSGIWALSYIGFGGGGGDCFCICATGFCVYDDYMESKSCHLSHPGLECPWGGIGHH